MSSSSFNLLDESSIERWLDCRDGFSVNVTPYNTRYCRAGYVCNATHESSCDDIRDAAITTFRFGGIHDGLYCPENSSFLHECKQSYYCPNASTQILCPKGKYCASKTREPYIICEGCPAGATRLYPNLAFGLPALVIILVLVLAYIIHTLVQRYKRENSEKMELMANRILNAKDVERQNQKREERLNRLRSKFEIINRRLHFDDNPDKKKIIDEALSISDDKIFFDEMKFFILLDEDKCGTVSYEELNAVLQLEPKDLKEFISVMSSLQGDKTQEEVSKDIFVRKFLDALEESTSFQLTPEEAGIRWDEMSQRKKITTGGEVKVKLKEMYHTSISDFLSEKQISNLISKFRGLDEEEGFQKETERTLVTREFFCKHYPRLLNEVLNLHEIEMSTTLKSKGGIDIAFKNLNLTVKAGRTTVNVVDDVTGRIRKGEMTALMGGSGAGKTSLLCALCGKAYYGEVKGEVFINGHNGSIQDYASNIGFVPQDDILFAELTVKENLIFSGRFRLPKGTPIHEIEYLAEDVMASLGLARKAKSLVGDVTRRGLSGGEKKRVNIGLEMMIRPSALFLDEPTSGLDASSALLVMKSLKELSETNGVTVCSVIHQPRKVIFDLHDSIILLNVGGRMVYHGKVHEAKSYFTELGYTLEPGESIADWMIDISTGRIAPEMGEGHTINRPSKTEEPVFLGKVASSIISTRSEMDIFTNFNNKTRSSDDAIILRRQFLVNSWKNHFSSLSTDEMDFYEPPPTSDLPVEILTASFITQFFLQLKRFFILAWRNRLTKIIETTLLIAVVTIMTYFLGPNDLEMSNFPSIPYEILISGSKCQERFIAAFFEGAIKATQFYLNYGLNIGMLTSILLSITAAKTLKEKKLEFYREAGSGYSVSAYFAAINIYTTIEQGVQVLFAAALVNWLWQAISDRGVFFLNFILLMWISVSWSLLISLILPSDIATLGVVFFVAITCFVLTPPVILSFKDIYDSNVLSVISAFLSPTRFFTETMVVSDYRCLQSQTGYTVNATEADNFPSGMDSFTLAGLALNDPSVTVKSCSGWYWNTIPALMVGLTVRVAAFGVIKTFNRSKQARMSFWDELRFKSSMKLYLLTVLFSLLLLGLAILTCWTILRKG